MYFLLQRISSNFNILPTMFFISLFLFGWIGMASYYTKYARLPFLDRRYYNKSETWKAVQKLDYVKNSFQQTNRATTNGDTEIKEVRVFCMVLTMPSNHEKKAIHVKNTWGKRCNKLIFISSVDNETLPSVNLGYTESRKILWAKTRKGFKYVYDHYLQDYDWFLKADDDTYVIVENLRYMLSAYDPLEDAIYFGSHYKNRFEKYNKNGYMGGGGYVLSQKSLKLLIEKGIYNSSICHHNDTSGEDVEIGFCLDNLGVMAGDSRDSLKRGRFFHDTAGEHLVPNKLNKNLWYYPIASGTSECCSELAISFHHVPPTSMYEYEYLIYRLHPYGVHHYDPQRPLLPPDKERIPKRVLDAYRSQGENFPLV